MNGHQLSSFCYVIHRVDMSAFLATALSLISVANGGEMRMSSDMSVRVCVLLHRSSLSCIYIYIYIYIYRVSLSLEAPNYCL